MRRMMAQGGEAAGRWVDGAMRGGLFKGLRARSARGLLGLILAGVGAATVAAGALQPSRADVIGVRLGGDSAQTRIVVDLRRAASGRVAPDTGRSGVLAIDLSGVDAAGPLEGRGRGLVGAWSIGNADGGVRLDLELTHSARVERRFLLPPADGVANYRYVIDIAASAVQARAVRTSSPVSAPAAVAASPFAMDAAWAPPPLAHRRKVIVIDPGHGGKDPGAAGAWSYEKNVTLAAAKVLRALLERSGRYRVVMTRDADVFVPLEERVQIARRAGADLFISLHADSGADPATHGASVYTLSASGTARVGDVLSRRDWFLQPAVNRGDHAVSQILLDLSQRSTRNRSAEFAQLLIDRVGDRAPLLERSRRDADYFVLLAPDVPAALLEMGFITNPRDEARLDDPRARAALMGEVADAIDAYFAPKTRLAAR